MERIIITTEETWFQRLKVHNQEQLQLFLLVNTIAPVIVTQQMGYIIIPSQVCLRCVRPGEESISIITLQLHGALNFQMTEQGLPDP